jgi:hypothetical protein
MAPKRKDYIGFLMEVEENEELAKGFFSNSKKSAKDLKDFFRAQGFTEIELEHSKQIKKGMKAFKKRGGLQPGDSPPCPPNTHY